MIRHARPDHAAENGRIYGWRTQRPTIRNPMSWSVPAGRLFGVEWRIHAIFIVYILVECARAIAWPGADESLPLGIGPTAIWLACLLVVVVLHEAGHILIGRLCGSPVTESVLWPLGGLSEHEAQSWKSNLATSSGGLLVNATMCVATTLWLGLATGQWIGVAIPSLYGDAGLAKVGHSLALMALYFLCTASYLLLWFNLLPMIPMDGARMVRALFRPRLGSSGSMRWTINISLVTVGVVIIVAALLRHWWMGGAAVIGGVYSFLAEHQLQFTDEVLGRKELPLARNENDRKPIDAGETDSEPDEAAELDRILQKIAERGLESLTKAEQARLKAETDRRRRTATPGGTGGTGDAGGSGG